MDYYKILGIEENASEGEIRRAYRRAVRVSHPDYSGERDASRFREIQEAYEILSDPVMRASYDQDRGEPVEVAVRVDVHRGQRSRTQVREIFPGPRGGCQRQPIAGSSSDPFEDLLYLVLRFF